VRGRETFDQTWAEIKQVILGTWWRDLQMAEAEKQEGDDNGEA
jgi:chromosome partitioning protein